MENITLVKKNNNTEIWLRFKGEKDPVAAICLNNIALQRGPIVKKAMLEAIAKELKL